MPGAWCTVKDEQVTLLGSTITEYDPEHAFPICDADDSVKIDVDGCALSVRVTDEGLAFDFPDGARVIATKFQVGRKVMDGSNFLERDEGAVEMLELSEKEGEHCIRYTRALSPPPCLFQLSVLRDLVPHGIFLQWLSRPRSRKSGLPSSVWMPNLSPTIPTSSILARVRWTRSG